jgi:hypothetical protein
MTVRALNSTLKNSLMNYDPFVVAHLIKFEKPQNVSQYGGTLKGLATDYTYITDAQYDIEYDDGTTTSTGDAIAPQLYRANKVTKIGTVNESIQAKAANMTLVLDSTCLGAVATTSATFTASVMTGSVDLVAEGFQEGDKILLSGSGNTNNGAYVRIDSFQNEGKTITFTQISSISANSSAQTYTITLASEEINILLTDKNSSSYSNYINREVTIYKVHINPETREIIGGINGPYLYFKGITSGASINEKLDSSEITWTLSSHWGDFIRVQGRLTDDATHRALRSDGSPDLESVIKPEYAGDLGFLHANTAINHIATYNTTEIEYKQVDINGGWFGGKRLREVEVDVPRQTDLQFNIQAKMLPVVYGVRKVDSFPIFVDTDRSNSADVYRADAICEGPIAGVLDIYLEDNSTICLDKADFDTRATDGSNYNSSSVEIICAGRMDRGDTLAHYSANTGANQKPDTYQVVGSYGRYDEYMRHYQHTETRSVASGTQNGSTSDATGILHEGTHTIKSPLTASFTFHSGQEDQSADNTLVSMAADERFKIQKDYYTGTARYWGTSHRLLDTAYVVGKYTIAEGETTLPEMKFVVRGRDPECYNYDYSYRQDTQQSNAALSNFSLGDTVTLKKSNGNMSDTTVTIIDKWSTFDVDGNRDHRFRFSPAPTLGLTTAFYMQSGSNNWHMQTWDHSENAEDVAGNLYHSNISVASGTDTGRKITLNSPSAAFTYAVDHAKAIIGVYSSSNSGLLASNYADFSYSSNIIDNVGRFTTDPGISRVYVKNAIQLDSSAEDVNQYYVGNSITLTDTSGEAPYVQERRIVAYDGTTRVAIVDSPWDYNYQPSTSMGYAIGSIGDRRVSINPAIQLLDYMTNKRYGKGLDITKDINIEGWKDAARDCDTRSTVTIATIPSASVSVGDVYKYPASGPLQFMGTVSSETDLGGKKQVVFKDVVGKLGTKWNSWQTFASNQLYWNNGNLFQGGGAIISTAPTSGGLSSISLAKVGGGTLPVDLSSASANGNPIVKAYSARNNDYTDSGYSLYDSDDVKYWRYLGWDDNSQRNVTRHQMNQVVDTKLPLFDNINRMLSQFNGILRYTQGKYDLEIKGKKPSTVDVAERISNEDIIGTIKLSDKGLKNSKNYVSTSIIDPMNKFEGRSVSFFNSTYLKEDKGIQKKGQFSLPGVTNYFNARFNIQQYLDESRYGLTVQFTMAPKGLLLVAGSIIEFTYPRFGYTSKPFRITNINFKNDGTVDITADEHTDDAYVVSEGGNSFGIIEEPGAGQAPEPLPIPARPTGLQATQTNQGEVVLTWTNTSTFSSATHEVEVYRGTTNNFAHESVVKVGSSTTNIYNDPISTGSGLTTRYYWIRYVVRMPQLNLAGSEFRNVPSLFYPNTADSGFDNGEGITGVGLAVNAVRSISIDPGTTTSFVYQNDETGIESGYTTSTSITTTKQNDAGTVTYVWKLNDVVINGATSANYTYTPPNAFGSMPQKVSVHMTDTVGSETFTATDIVTFTGTKVVVNGSPGLNGFTVTASNGTHNFTASSTGTINSVSSYASTFTVLKGTTTLTYDAGANPAANTYKFGSIGNVSPANSLVPINTNGTITISSSSGSILSGTSVTQATFDVPIIENDSGSTIATFKMSITKNLDGGSGLDGVKTALVYAYQRSSSALTTNPGAITVNLNTGKISTASLANSWEKEIPSGSDPLYVVAASAAGTGSSDNIAANEWSGAVVLAQNGIDADALTVTVDTSTAGQTTFNFSDGSTATIQDGADANALTVSSSYDASTGQTTLTFSDGSTATVNDGSDGTSKGVKPLYAATANPTAYSQVSLTQGTNAFVNFYEFTGTYQALSDAVITALTFVKIVGEDGDSEGVVPIYAADASGTSASFTQGSLGFVNFYEWTGSAPTSVPANLTYAKFVGEDGESEGVVPIYASDASGTSASFTQGSLGFVNFYEWTGSAPASVPANLTYVKFVGEDGDSEGVVPIYAADASGTSASFTQGSLGFVNFYEWTGTAPTSVPANLTYVRFVGEDGDPGLNSATVFIFKKTNSSTETTKPSGDTTYTFDGGGVSFSTANNWSATIPSGTETYLWARTATAASTGSTDTIADSEWSPAQLLAVGGGDGVRGGGIFTFEESTDSNISAATASAYAGTLTTAAAQAVGAAAIAAAPDSTIRPNDRITVTDNSASKAGTRVYTGSPQTASGSVATGDFSSLVVETFDGSVIVDGTLSADKLAANTIIGNNIRVGSNLELNSDGAFYTSNKTTYADNDAGFFLGYDTDAHKLNLGNANNYVKWDGANLNIAGTIAMTSSSTIGSGTTTIGDVNTTATTANSTANTANSTANTANSTANTANSTANTASSAASTAQSTANTASSAAATAQSTANAAASTAGGASSGNSRAFMNNNGLVVVDGSGTKRVKIGNIGSL